MSFVPVRLVLTEHSGLANVLAPINTSYLNTSAPCEGQNETSALPVCSCERECACAHLCTQACPCTCLVLCVPHRSAVNSSNVCTVCQGSPYAYHLKSITVPVLLWLSLCLCFLLPAFRAPASDGSIPCQPPCSSLIMLTASSQIKAVTTAAGQSRLVQFISRYVKWIHGEKACRS